jgi:hypothetical protein
MSAGTEQKPIEVVNVNEESAIIGGLGGLD